jgi:hypothetical protein
MSDDILAQATRALRESTDADPDRSSSGEASSSARFTRARVMASLHQRTVRRRTRTAFLLPIAATLGTVSAWGAASGKAPELWDALTRTLGIENAAEPAARAGPPLGRSTGALRRPAQAAVKHAPVLEPAREDPAPAVPEPSPAPAVSAAPSASNTARPVLPDPTHDLYRRAHRAHFAEHNPARALALWDEYLRAAPRGRFSVEARYNRALCLVRLGRRAEARAALDPFASGTFGGYRQNEAAELREALGE